MEVADIECSKILNYFAAVEALTPLRIGKPGEGLRGFTIQNGKRIDWSPPPSAAKTLKYMETLNLVHVGLYTARAAVEAVEELLSLSADEDMDDDATASQDEPKKRSKTGDCSLASFVVDASGHYVPGSFRLSTFAAALATMHRANPVPDAWMIAEVCADTEKDVQDKKYDYIDANVIRDITDIVVQRLITVPKLSDAVASVIQFQIRRGKDTDTEEDRAARIDAAVPRMSSFFLSDIQFASAMLEEGRLANSPLLRYLSPEPLADADRRDAGAADVLAETAENPVVGKWPSKSSPSWRQRVAVSAAAGLEDGGLLALCGPPGTGKSYTIKQMLGAAIVRRVIAMAAFDDPRDAFKRVGTVTINSGRDNGKSFPAWQIDKNISDGIGVFSANNGAVESVIREIAVLESDASGVHETSGFASYLPEIADRVLHGKAPKTADRKITWGLCAAVLGRRSNVRAFRTAFMSEFETLADVRIRRIFPKESVKGGPHAGKPKICMQATHDDRDIYLEFTGDDLAAQASLLSRRSIITVVASERAITSAKVDARYDVAELNPVTEEKYIRECIGDADSNSLANWHRARADFLTALDALEQYQPPAADHVGQMTDDGYLEFLSAVQDGREVSAAALSAARAFEAQTPAIGRDSEKARLAVGDADRLAEALFTASFGARQAFIRRAGSRILDNLRVWQTNENWSFSGKGNMTEEAWRAFFLVVPVFSSTLASITRLLGGCGPSFLGDAIFDESGQASPHAVVGALMRCRRAVVVGDPLQITPISSIPDRVSGLLAEHSGLPSDDFLIGSATDTSAQTVADRVSPIGATISGRRVGIPLTVNRRNAPAMLAVCNAIAYDGMIVGTVPAPIVGPGVGHMADTWFDVTDEIGFVRNRVPAQERVALDLLLAAVRDGSDHMPSGMPDLFIVTPFRSSAQGMRKMVTEHSYLFDGVDGRELEAWTEARIGTVHTVQGRESQVVVMLLGGVSANERAVAWAELKPNLLNVAMSRGKRHTHLIGNRVLWTKTIDGVFEVLAADKPLGMAFPSLSVPVGHTVVFSGSVPTAVPVIPYPTRHEVEREFAMRTGGPMPDADADADITEVAAVMKLRPASFPTRRQPFGGMPMRMKSAGFTAANATVS